MQRLSSTATRFVKRGIPAVAFAVLAVVAVQALRNGPADTALPLLFIVGFAILLVTVIFSAVLSKLADEVIDHGTHLVFRQGTRETTVELKHITNVGYSALATPRTVWLSLASTSAVGRQISFIPKDAPFGFSVPAVVTELRERVHAARSSASAA